jgi:hypothetical protein
LLAGYQSFHYPFKEATREGIVLDPLGVNCSRSTDLVGIGRGSVAVSSRQWYRWSVCSLADDVDKSIKELGRAVRLPVFVF